MHMFIIYIYIFLRELYFGLFLTFEDIHDKLLIYMDIYIYMYIFDKQMNK